MSVRRGGQSSGRRGREVTPRLVGTLLVERYRIQNIIGRGGDAIVYEADDVLLSRKVAVKVPVGPDTAPMAAVRFRREARACSSLAHPNVCALFDFGFTPNGLHFLVMERLIGETLRSRLARERYVPLADAVGIMTDILEGLGAAHAIGLVHRDMKPGNVFITQGPARPLAKVLDFGLAFFPGDEDQTPEGGTEVRTATGIVVGTPNYMAPEQIAGRRGLDARTDIFACGAILYEMVTGVRPFRGSNLQALCAKILSGAVTPATSRRPGLPEEVNGVLARAMAVDPVNRFPTTAAFSRALERVRGANPRDTTAGAPREPDAERMAYLQTRFREMMDLGRLQPPPPIGQSTTSLDIPVQFDDRSDTTTVPRAPRDYDPNGTAPTMPRPRRRRPGSR